MSTKPKPTESDADEALLREGIIDPTLREQMLEVHRRERVRAEALERDETAQTNLDRKGEKLERTKHIVAIATRPENMNRSAQWLFDNLSDADKAVVGNMAFSSFRKHVPRRK